MPFVSSKDLRENLAKMLDGVVETGEPLTVTRNGGRGNVVIMPEAEFASWQQTVRVLRLPENAEMLLRAIRGNESKARTHLTEAAD